MILAQFCKSSVEPMGEESDHVHITALSDALGVPIRVVYLDRSSCDNGGVSVNHHDFIPAVNGSAKPKLTLLYRPGHYDILYPKWLIFSSKWSWPWMPGVSIGWTGHFCVYLFWVLFHMFLLQAVNISGAHEWDHRTARFAIKKFHVGVGVWFFCFTSVLLYVDGELLSCFQTMCNVNLSTDKLTVFNLVYDHVCV